MYFDYLEVIVTNEQPDYVVALAKFLKEKNRPLFAEDLPSQYQSLFNELESFHYPNKVVVKPPFLLLEFNNVDEDLHITTDEMIESLKNMALSAVVIFTFNEQEEWEEEEDCTKFYLLEDQKLKRLSVEKVKQRTGIELDESFNNSEDILWALVGNTNF